MKPRKRLVYLSSLRKEIVALVAVKCHMSHERIIKSPDSRLPVRCHFPEGDYRRVGLCGPETRAQRLGCSHTMARIKLNSAIDSLVTDDEDNNGPGQSLGDELNWLNNEIHLLDHRKGEAEKALATLLEACGEDDRMCQDERLREAAEKVHEMERLHDDYVDRIGILRDRVVTEIDRLIESYRAASATQTGRDHSRHGIVEVIREK